MSDTDRLRGDLVQLRSAIAGARLPLNLPGATDTISLAKSISQQLDDYVLPRLENLDAPLLVIVGGSTGTGKSTLVNSLLWRQVSAAGVVRPTTRSAVLVHNPKDEAWFATRRILPNLIRTHAPGTDASALQLVSEPSLPAGIAVLDAPDIDSVVDANRNLASELLAAGDLWLFVTSAARYSDAVPWGFLNEAAARDATVALILDRVPEAAMGIVPDDLAQLMAQAGLGDAKLFVIPEGLGEGGLLPENSVTPIRSWLASLAADSDQRHAIVLRTLEGAISAIGLQASAVAMAVDEQVAATERLVAYATGAYHDAFQKVSAKAGDGTLFREEIFSRWHELVGTNRLVKIIDKQVSKIRDRFTSLLHPEVGSTEEVQLATKAGLEALLHDAGQDGAERAANAWQNDPATAQILTRHPELAYPSQGYDLKVAQLIADWQRDILAMVSEEGRDKKHTAQWAAAGVNGIGAALMLVIFASTGGLTGAELGVAGGTAVVAQRLLESIFGDEAVRKLAKRAKTNLDERMERLLNDEAIRFVHAIDELGITIQPALQIRSAMTDIEQLRRGDDGTVVAATDPSGQDSEPFVWDLLENEAPTVAIPLSELTDSEVSDSVLAPEQDSGQPEEPPDSPSDKPEQPTDPTDSGETKSPEAESKEAPDGE